MKIRNNTIAAKTNDETDCDLDSGDRKRRNSRKPLLQRAATCGDWAKFSSFSRPSRIYSNALYITFYFVGGALESYIGAYGWSRSYWSGVCGLSLGLLAIAFVVFFRGKQIVSS
ncbi:MAG: hypothetical protein KME43_08120 [Myxacorys chilensis ATA2-1-KO14]|jgi:hypothetical protein|nr:hypothetical protein [Myxacorys chilensis ATA2-1-KO14]